MKKNKKIIYFFIAFLILPIDQIAKHLARSFIDSFEVIKILPFLQLVSIQNKGAAFGLFSGLGNKIFIAITITAIAFIFYLLVRGRENNIGLPLILGGATGNLIDRILFGGVTDFIDVFIGRFHWPAFNIADSALTIGVILMLLTQLRQSKGFRVVKDG